MWSTPSTTSSVTLGRLARKRLIRSSRTSSPPAATAIDPESEVTSIRWIGSVNAVCRRLHGLRLDPPAPCPETSADQGCARREGEDRHQQPGQCGADRRGSCLAGGSDFGRGAWGGADVV